MWSLTLFFGVIKWKYMLHLEYLEEMAVWDTDSEADSLVFRQTYAYDRIL